MQKFQCSCGKEIQPPRLNPTMFLGQEKGTFHVSVSYPCPNCKRQFNTDFKGRIENSLIYLKK